MRNNDSNKREHSKSVELRQGHILENALSCDVELHTVYLFIV